MALMLAQKPLADVATDLDEPKIINLLKMLFGILANLK